MILDRRAESYTPEDLDPLAPSDPSDPSPQEDGLAHDGSRWITMDHPFQEYFSTNRAFFARVYDYFLKMDQMVPKDHSKEKIRRIGLLPKVTSRQVW